MINILILAAGYQRKQGGYPICLSEVGGMPLLQTIVASCNKIKNAGFSFAFVEEEVKKFRLDQVAKLITNNPKIILVPQKTLGSGCTALYASSLIDPDSELLILSANELIDIDLSLVIKNFQRTKLSAGTVVFPSVHPRYSFVRLNEVGDVVEAAQQNPISDNATAGLFWFKKTHYFIDSCKSMIKKNVKTNDKYYIAPVFNEMILNHQRVGAYKISSEQYKPFKASPQE